MQKKINVPQFFGYTQFSRIWGSPILLELFQQNTTWGRQRHIDEWNLETPHPLRDGFPGVSRQEGGAAWRQRLNVFIPCSSMELIVFYVSETKKLTQINTDVSGEMDFCCLILKPCLQIAIQHPNICQTGHGYLNLNHLSPGCIAAVAFSLVVVPVLHTAVTQIAMGFAVFWFPLWLC